MGDEGFGVHVIRHLESACHFPEDVRLHDAGTAGIYLAPILEDVERAMVVDVIRSEKAPGTLEFLDGERLSGRDIQSSMSPHQVGILEIVEICRLRGTAPEQIEFFCVVPERVATGLELSPLLKEKVREVSLEIVKRLRLDGYSVMCSNGV
jgi:hydrogenase maturation protease